MAHKSWPQCLVAILSNISILAFGLQVGWLSPLQPGLQSDHSPLGEDVAPLTDNEVSWIGALPSVAYVLCAPLFGYWLDRYGRKMTLFISTAPNIISFLMLLFANNITLVYIARIVGGFCSIGGFIVTPIYVNEISDDKFRSFLGGLTGSFVKIGIIVSFILGGYCSYFVLNFCSLLFIIFFLVFYLWMPESPYYLIGKGKKNEARSALLKLRGDDKVVEMELQEMEDMLQKSHCSKGKNSNLFKAFFTRPNLKALFIICSIYTVQMLSGYPAIMRYTVDIFQDSGISYSPYLAAIFVAVAQLVAAFIGAALLEKTGCKTILIICTILMAASMFVMCVALYLDVKSGWLRYLPTLSLIVFVGGYAAGYGTAPFVLFPSLFAPEDRGCGAAVSNLWISSLEFVMVKLFLPMNSLIGLVGSLSIFCFICSLGAIFLQVVMFETKGLTFEAIYQILSGRPQHAADEEGQGSETEGLRA